MVLSGRDVDRRSGHRSVKRSLKLHNFSTFQLHNCSAIFIIFKFAKILNSLILQNLYKLSKFLDRKEHQDAAKLVLFESKLGLSSDSDEELKRVTQTKTLENFFI